MTEEAGAGFNSLDAQREACAAYIASQRHEGWTALPEAYDDGGLSGGTMNRPALQRLFNDIKTGKVNTIVVYKIDRLTRSLADFAKMVELFDAHNVTFVSVTQQFNTTSSMGRLTLNVLLSFAQFEREVTAERIRDKIAASKAKGMWMGGTVPLGYTTKDRQLHIHPTEANLIRHIFTEYLRLGSVLVLAEQLRAQGHTTRPGKPFRVGNLSNILTNPIYIGKVPHKGKVYEGLHKPIIDKELWDNVQNLRHQSRANHRHRIRGKERSLLAGKLVDALGNPMSPGHAHKHGRRYRYYISQGILQGKNLPDGVLARIPASEIESLVLRFSHQLLQNDDLVSQILENNSLFLRRESQRLAAEWNKQTSQHHTLIRTLISLVKITNTSVTLHISRQGMRAILEGQYHTTQPAKDDFSQLIPIKLKPVEGGATHILTDGHLSKPREPNPELVRAIAHGHVANRMLKEGQTQNAIATQLGIAERQVRRVLPFGLLAPDIVTSILDGTQPPALSITLLSGIAIHHDWPTQRARLATL
ncbi:MAG: recombinase family protein [Pseudomonadaceae bacterium]|nr:recombinase family protein [Pseudomonadaceae bacterium]